jgi:hypothetical protein
MKSVRAFTRFAFFVFVLLLPARAFCEATMQQILTNGPTDKRINIVLLSEGYTAAELDRFAIEAEQYIYHLFATPPFDEYRSYFNAFIISVASAESGSDHPSRNDYHDTYFNTSYGTGDAVRLLSIPYGAGGLGKADTLLSEFVPGHDFPLILVNDDEYGGAGGATTLVSRNSLGPDAAVHELGHTLAYLDDEYSSGWSGAGSGERPNSTRETRREFIKWHHWIDDSTPIPTPETLDFKTEVGLFEGAHYQDTGWYRPKYNCKMNQLGAPFCEVCMEALVISFYGRLNSIDAFSPLNPEVKVANEPVTLSVEPLQPETHTLDIQWFIDNTPVSGATSAEFVVSAESLTPGTYEVVAEVRDATQLVRADPEKKLINSHSWHVTVSAQPPKAPTPPKSTELDMDVARDSNGNFVINLTGPLGSTYVIQSTSDFVTWETLATVTNATGKIHIFDPLAREQPLRFYRAVEITTRYSLESKGTK